MTEQKILSWMKYFHGIKKIEKLYYAALDSITNYLQFINDIVKLIMNGLIILFELMFMYLK